MRAASRGSPDGGDLAAIDAALEQRLPLLLVVAADQLDAGELAAPDQVRQLALVVARGPCRQLDVVDRRRASPAARGTAGPRPRSGAGAATVAARRASPRETRPPAPRPARRSCAKRRCGILLEAAGDQRLQGGRHVGAQPAAAAPGRARSPRPAPGPACRAGSAARPVAISWRIRPSENWSVRWSTGLPARLLGRHVLERAQQHAQPACRGATASRAPPGPPAEPA